ncbi:MAG: TetR/AcrR family transcriptional regulator [Aquabacterium sp.]
MKATSSALEAGDTKLIILRAARELIQTRSYLGLSFQELADRVGIRKASLYHHFPSKEALGIAVLERSNEQFGKWVASMQGTPQAQLSAYIAMFRDVLGAGQRVCPAGAMGPGWDSIEPGLQQAVRQMRQRQIDWLTIVLAQIKSSRVTKQGEPAQLAAEVFALCQGALLSARMTGRREDFEAAVAPLMEQLHLPPLP